MSLGGGTDPSSQTGGGSIFGRGGGGPIFGPGGMFGNMTRPTGQFGPRGSCGCSSLFIIVAGMLLVCGGLMRMFNF